MKSRMVWEAKRRRSPFMSAVVRTGFLAVWMLPGWWVSRTSTFTPLCSLSRYLARNPASFSTFVPISALPIRNGMFDISVSGKRPGVKPWTDQVTSARPVRAMS